MIAHSACRGQNHVVHTRGRIATNGMTRTGSSTRWPGKTKTGRSPSHTARSISTHSRMTAQVSHPRNARIRVSTRRNLLCQSLPSSEFEGGQGQGLGAEKPASNVKSLQVYRWNPAKNANPTMDTFHIDREQCGPMVLDALVKINDQIDPSLSFRRSCREGVCGSCAMNIDGKNHLRA